MNDINVVINGDIALAILVWIASIAGYWLIYGLACLVWRAWRK